jgi:hypothetical protein
MAAAQIQPRSEIYKSFMSAESSAAAVWLYGDKDGPFFAETKEGHCAERPERIQYQKFYRFDSC